MLDYMILKILDFTEGIFWLLFDSWRKPSVEFFTKLSKEQCIIRLENMLDENHGVDGYVSGIHFCLFQQRAWKRGWMRIPHLTLALTGKLISTSKGTYVLAWHRFMTTDIVLTPFVIWISFAFYVLFLPFSQMNSFSAIPPQILLICGLATPVLFLVVAFFMIRIGEVKGENKNAQLGEFLPYKLSN